MGLLPDLTSPNPIPPHRCSFGENAHRMDLLLLFPLLRCGVVVKEVCRSIFVGDSLLGLCTGVAIVGRALVHEVS